MATTISSEKELIWNDVKRWLINSFIFAIPSIVSFLTALEAGLTVKQALFAIYPAIGTSLMDLYRKYQAETRYVDGQTTKISDPIEDLGK